MTATALPTIRTPRFTPETPLEGTVLAQVFNTLRAYGPDLRGSMGAHCPDATQASKDRLRLRLAEYEAQDADLANVVLLVRRYFNTYRANGWRIVEWQVTAALKLLATVAEATAEAQDRCRAEDTDGEYACEGCGRGPLPGRPLLHSMNGYAHEGHDRP